MPKKNNLKPAIFLDRDGVISQKLPPGKYVTTPQEFILCESALDKIKDFKDAGFLVFIVTNQRGVALQKMTLEAVHTIHAVLSEKLKQLHVSLDGIYICPHDENTCTCRKPLPGLILRAQQDFPDIDLTYSIMIGDSSTDIAAGKAAGCKTLIFIGSKENLPQDATHCYEKLKDVPIHTLL